MFWVFAQVPDLCANFSGTVNLLIFKGWLQNLPCPTSFHVAKCGWENKMVLFILFIFFLQIVISVLCPFLNLKVKKKNSF